MFIIKSDAPMKENFLHKLKFEKFQIESERLKRHTSNALSKRQYYSTIL